MQKPPDEPRVILSVLLSEMSMSELQLNLKDAISFFFWLFNFTSMVSCDFFFLSLS